MQNKLQERRFPIKNSKHQTRENVNKNKFNLRVVRCVHFILSHVDGLGGLSKQ